MNVAPDLSSIDGCRSDGVQAGVVFSLRRLKPALMQEPVPFSDSRGRVLPQWNSE
jgi:hypothetical protein